MITLRCPECKQPSGIEALFSNMGRPLSCRTCGVMLDLGYDETTDDEGSFSLERADLESSVSSSLHNHADPDPRTPDIIDPRGVYLAIPCGDGRLMSEVAGSVVQTMGLWSAISMPSECSHVSLVRNLIASQFLASSCEWLVCVDNDIRFSRQDYLLLLQPKDPDKKEDTLGAAPAPTRVATTTAAGTRTMADVLVVAEYAYKNDTLEPVKNGMGFVRIHRSVFRTLEALKHDHGTVNVPGELWDQLLARTQPGSVWDPMEVNTLIQEIGSKAEDTRGANRLFTCSWQGRQFYDYFPSGPLLSQFVPNQQWMGEDHGFFTLCMLAGIVARSETRTRLVHIGRKGYEYAGPDSGAGQ